VSEPFELVIEPDTLDATNVKLEYTTFYPYKDGYRDTIHVSGMRSEPISVSIKIYSPTGSLVKSVSVARASGKYSYNWNGRNSAGTIRAAGKYKFVQKLTDAAGTTKTFTLYATLSHKKLVTKTAYVEKPGNDVSAKGTDGSASISVSSSGGSAKLTAGSNAWAGVGYGFSIPTAVVYKSISFQVYAKGTHSVPANEIGLQNFTTCPYSTDTWNEGCFDHWKPIGSQLGSIPTATWYSAPGSVTSNRHSHWIRGMVSVNWGTVTVYKARAKVVYGVLQ
jgi:FlgD Ig-like domain